MSSDGISINSGFARCFGHQTALHFLSRMLENPRRPHALLFSGPAAVGKRTIAQTFAGLLLRPDRSDSRPAAVFNYPDFHLVRLEDEKKDISVEDIRALRGHLQLKPYQAPVKVALIDHAERMSIAACNALLMTLEEPTEHTLIILVSSASHRLPATILSRCNIVHFGFLEENNIRHIVTELMMPADDTSNIIEQLVESTDGTLGSLFLDRFIDQSSLQVKEHGELLSHLESLSRRTTEIRAALQRFFADDSAAATSHAVALGSMLAQEEDDAEIVWSELRLMVSKMLREGSASQTTKWAEVMTKLVHADRLVHERNANPALQLSSLLMEMTDCQ